ncbi:hypothetical protein SAMN05518849_12411 [Sphingobium sp. AP50]|nr:hypothetical protein SAMN05518849_12411 [Sphingobium sp. AP50]
MKRLNFSASVLISGLLLATQASARDARPIGSAKLFDDMLQCRSLADANMRLACYDKQVAAISDAQAKNEVAVIDKESVRQTVRQNFGLATPAVPLAESSGGNGREEALDEIQTKVVSFQPTVRDRWRLQLADGSEWQTLETIAFRVPEVNMAVTVKKAALGSYLLRPAGWPAVRARRIK